MPGLVSNRNPWERLGANMSQANAEELGNGSKTSKARNMRVCGAISLLKLRV